MDNVWDHAQTISTISVYLVTLEFIISKTFYFVYYSVTKSPVTGLSFLVMNLRFSFINLFLLMTFLVLLFIHYMIFCIKILSISSSSHLLSMAHDKITQIEEIIVKEYWSCIAYDTNWLWLCHFTSLISLHLWKIRIGVLLHG